MRTDDVKNEFRWEKASIVLAKRGAIIFRDRVSQPAFVFHPAFKSTGPSYDPFCLAGGAERRKAFTHGRLRGFLPEGKHPIRVKGSMPQICLLFGCQNEGFGCGRTLYVNSFRLHGLANVTDHAVVGDVNALFAAIQPDLHERNGNPVMFLSVLVYRAEMVVWAELFERRDERSSLCCQIHKASLF